jgi:hypothetical protein
VVVGSSLGLALKLFQIELKLLLAVVFLGVGIKLCPSDDFFSLFRRHGHAKIVRIKNRLNFKKKLA